MKVMIYADSKLKHYAIQLLAAVPGEMKHIDKQEYQLYQKQLFLYKGTTLYLGRNIPFAVVAMKIADQKYRINIAQMYYNHLNTFNNQDFWTQENNTESPMNFYEKLFGASSLQDAEKITGGHLVDFDQEKNVTYLDYATPDVAAFLHYLENGIKPKIVTANNKVDVLSNLNSKELALVSKPGPVFIIESDPIGTLMPEFLNTLKFNIHYAKQIGEIDEPKINLDSFYYQLLKGNYVRETIAKYAMNQKPAVEFTLNVNRSFNVTLFDTDGKIKQTHTDTLSGNVFRLNQELQKINCKFTDKLGIFNLNELIN